jgi:hypothetical protein
MNNGVGGGEAAVDTALHELEDRHVRVRKNKAGAINVAPISLRARLLSFCVPAPRYFYMLEAKNDVAGGDEQVDAEE